LRIAVDKNERAVRLDRVKAIGRVAYRLVSAEKIEGFLDLQDGRKLHREFNRDGLFIELYEAANRVPHWSDFSQLRIRHAGRRALVIRWNAGSLFKVVHYDPGDWEHTLRSWSATDSVK
jgi:hypothetical protein